MGKKEGSAETSRNQKNPRTETIKKHSATVNGNNQAKSKYKTNKQINGSASHEDPQVLVVPSSSTETENNYDGESTEEEDRINERSSSDEGEEVLKHSYQRKGKKEEVKIKGKKTRKKEQVGEVEAVEKIENALYKFPMNRVSRIIRSENSDARISQEAIFVINRASEKFLELFSREAYACAFLDRKSYIAYHHLSSVVSKRKRFDFVSDFIPEKVKGEVALSQIPETEK